MYTRGCYHHPGWQVEAPHVIPIHFFFPLAGGSAAIIILLFSLGMVIALSMQTSDGSIRFISNGMEELCGWTELILGTSGALLCMCYLVPAIHVGGTLTVASVFVQMLGWNGTLGIHSTGWVLHYIALAAFCFSNIYFNYVMSRSWYGSAVYRRIHAVSVVFVLLFGISFFTTHFTLSTTQLVSHNVSVCIELALLVTITAQTLCLMWSMNRDGSMHIVIERFVPPA